MKTVLNKKNVPVNDRIMFLGEDLSLQRYDQFKYPKFFSLWEQQENYRWRPQRIDLSKDRVDFEKLSESERFVFESNIRWQTMTDSMLSRSIHKMSEYVTNPELELCMGTWASMEQMHSFSYTHIFKNVTKNATAFFDSILDDKEIVGRANAISKAYDELLNDETDLKQRIFNSVICTNITEGVAFYTSFVCSFFFGYKGLMEGSAKIIGEIARDENLHVAITQNIIKNWKNHEEEGFQKVLADNEEKVYELYRLAVKNEKAWADYLFSRGSLLGLNTEVLHGYVEWLANTRLQAMGYKRIFNQKTNPVSGWSTRYFDSTSVQVAPQESELESYLVGSANTALNDSDLDNITL
jgi:ribonucleoside-diphosphate reductase beta chain